jgi:hypothetical protein
MEMQQNKKIEEIHISCHASISLKTWETFYIYQKKTTQKQAQQL